MKEAYRLVGVMFFVIGVCGFLLNLTWFLLYPDSVTFKAYNIPMLVCCAVIFLLSITKNSKLQIQLLTRRITINLKRINVIFQFVFVLVASSFLIFSRDQHPYVMTMVLIAGIMGIKYNIMHYKGVILLTVYYLILMAIDGSVHGCSFYQVKIFMYTVWFFLILILLFQDELRAQFDLMRKYREQAVQIRKRLELYESQTLNPEGFGLTRREMEVLEKLCLTNASNKVLADELGIRPQTVKTHLRNIFDKAGVDDRHQLVDLCKGYFIET